MIDAIDQNLRETLHRLASSQLEAEIWFRRSSDLLRLRDHKNPRIYTPNDLSSATKSFAGSHESPPSNSSVELSLLLGLIYVQPADGSFQLSEGSSDQSGVNCEFLNPPSSNSLQLNRQGPPCLCVCTRFHYIHSAPIDSNRPCQYFTYENEEYDRYVEIVEYVLMEPVHNQRDESIEIYRSIEEYSRERRGKKRRRGEEKSADETRFVHLKGQITGFSPIIFFDRGNEGSEKLIPSSFFMVRLSSREEQTLSILFHDRHEQPHQSGLKWHRLLQMYEEITLSHLREYRLLNTSMKSRTLLVATSDTRITVSQNEEEKEEGESKREIDYTGTVTGWRQDSVIEMDNRVSVYLMDHPMSNQGRGMRVGSCLILYNVRPVYLYGMLHGLAASMYTQITVLEFSQDLNPSSYVKLRQDTSQLRGLWRLLTVPTLSWVFDCCERMKRKFEKEGLWNKMKRKIYPKDMRERREDAEKSVEQVCKMTGAKIESIERRKTDIYESLMDHRSHLERREKRKPKVLTMNEIPRDLFGDIEEEMECNKPVTRRSDGRLSLMGKIRVNEDDGSLLLSDDSGDIPLLLNYPIYDKERVLGSVWLIRSYTVVLERMYYIIVNNLEEDAEIIFKYGETKKKITLTNTGKGDREYDYIICLIYRKNHVEHSKDESCFKIEGKIVSRMNRHKNETVEKKGTVKISGTSLKEYPFLPVGSLVMLYRSQSDAQLRLRNNVYEAHNVEAELCRWSYRGQIYKSFSSLNVEDNINTEEGIQWSRIINWPSPIRLSDKEMGEEGIRGIVVEKSIDDKSGSHEPGMKILLQSTINQLDRISSKEGEYETLRGIIEGMRLNISNVRRVISKKGNLYFTHRHISPIILTLGYGEKSDHLFTWAIILGLLKAQYQSESGQVNHSGTEVQYKVLCMIEDSSAKASLFINDPAHLQILLRCDERTLRDIQREIVEYYEGEFKINRRTTVDEKTCKQLYKQLSTHKINRPVVVYARQYENGKYLQCVQLKDLLYSETTDQLLDLIDDTQPS
ncbi:hypothetical protein PROFUN_12013 [Planoprotostelium fungivorum]|uniref:CST complex subunit CTC1 n=1 Tax=Planoprotostelium fungivorum TaxID=1890364 RepID=A0A2P6MRG2_9EUKA|nr:hypothetical protein PROFUN_12013 [Planoprotostelium fungivorum]